MKIIEVTLENIKSYADRTTIQLQGGVTAILGENGSGKSTIQEAVGFALFDSLPFTISEFVREGASSGTVEVTIEVDERDGKQKYRVTRSAGYSKYGVARYDTKGEEWVDQDIASKDDLVEWLCTRFDLEDGDELQSLWESCIGVPQTRFLSDFAQTPKARTSTFDELLNIDAYEDSWNRLKDTPDHIKAERRGVREEILKLGATVQSLPKEREEKQNLEEKIAELTTEISTAESELAEATKRHDELDDIRERISDLEQEIKQQKQAIDAKESSLQTAQKELETTREAADKCESARDGHEQYLEAEAAEVADAADLRSQIGDTKAKIKALASEQKDLQEKIDRLRDADADAPCPTCGKSMDAAHRSETIETRETRLEEAQTERKTHREDLSTLEERLVEAEEVEQRVTKLEMYQSRVSDLRAELQDHSDKRTETREEISSRTQDIDDLPNHKTERESLEDAKEAFYTAKTQVKEYEDAPEDLAEVKESIESIEATITDLEDQIEAFDNIEADLETLEETLDTNEEDYKQFERNEQAANKLESRKEAIEEIDGEIEELRAKHGELTNDLESESEAFNQEEFDKLSNEIEDLNGRVHTLTAQKSEKEKTLDKVVDTVDTLEDKLEQRESKIETLRELAADQQFATWVRDNVREAGPKMRDVITDRIGRRADTIFRSIRGQKAEQLEWTSDYDIVVVDADVRKSFSTLSGGEKMAAALAVRLAILEQISGLGIAFLDEPTANLDQDKKANLVSQLTNLDTFEQLTVISHDATFDSMTDYSITIEKPDQTSAVMSD
jgi:exonuclease SbcC